MNDEGWEKVGMTPVWDYKNKKPGDTLVGVYMYKEEGIGENNSTLYTFELSDGSLVSIWGSTLLDTRFKHLEPGEEVKVIYNGKKPSPNRKGSSYHDFDVYHRAKPFTKVSSDDREVSPDEIPDDL